LSIEVKSAARFLYDQKGLTGFENPKARAFQTIRELVENSLDSCEMIRVLPEIRIKVQREKGGRYAISAVDNGKGVPDKQIPIAFGTMLSSSKYGNRQDRGMFGIGIKNVLLYSQVTSHKPYKVMSAISRDSKIDVYELMIDINTNQPKIIRVFHKVNKLRWRGLALKFYMVDVDFDSALKDILKYLELTNIICPHAHIIFTYNNDVYDFKRKINKVPEPPKVILPHPYDIDPLDFELLVKTTRAKNLHDFLTTHFYRVGSTSATNFLKFAKLDPERSPKSLTHDEMIYFIKKMKEYPKWFPPSTDCLSLIGEEYFIAGLKNIKFFSYYSKKGVFGGSPFAVEVCAVITNEKPRVKQNFLDNLTLYRIVNKIPLIKLYKSCLMWKVVESINWRYYNIDLTQVPLTLYIHVCSTSKRTLFKDLTKGTIAEIPEVEKALRLALQSCLRDVSRYIKGERRRLERQRRMSRFELYVPLIVDSLSFLSGEDSNSLEHKVRGVLNLGEKNE